MFRLIPAVLLFAASLSAQAWNFDKFTHELSEKVRFKDEKGYDKILKEYHYHALLHFRAQVRMLIRDETHEQSQAEYGRLTASWQRVFRTDTLEQIERWLRSQDIAQIRTFDNCYGALQKGKNHYFQLYTDKPNERANYEKLVESLLKLAEQFEYIGERTQAAETWGVVAQVYNIMPSRTLQDRKEAVYAIDRYQEHRDRWNYNKDQLYLTNVNWAKEEKRKIEEDEKKQAKRAAEGYDENITGIDSFLVVDADKTEKFYPFTFKPMSKFESKVDFSLMGGPSPMRWPSVTITGKGPIKMSWFRSKEMFLVRPGNNKYGVTFDGAESNLKKNPFQPVAAPNKIKKPSLIYLGDPKAKEDPYAMWFYTGGASEPFQGMSQNYAPTAKRAIVYYKSASSWVADVDGTPVTLFDDNSDGAIFTEDYEEDFGMTQRTLTDDFDEETKVSAIDSMQIGKKAKAVPFSNWVKVNGSWFHMRRSEDGKKFGLRATNPDYFKTGNVKVKWSAGKGTKLEALVVQGRGWFGQARFDISKGVTELPAAEYEVLFGRIVNGKKARMSSADLFAGSTEPFTVKPGETTELAFGAPFKLEYNREGEGRDLKINALTIKVIGTAGEIYRNVNGAPPASEILAAKDDTGKGAKAIGAFIALKDAQMASDLSKGQAIGFEVAYWPVVKGVANGSFVFEEFVPDGTKIGLKGDKNKLFGKLLPVFK